MFKGTATARRRCIDGDVKLETSIPMIHWNGRWSQICGHYFWDNDNGVYEFCRMLDFDDYDHYYHKRNQKSQKLGFWIGKCKDGEFPYCSGRCNKRTLGGIYRLFLGSTSCARRQPNVMNLLGGTIFGLVFMNDINRYFISTK